MKTKFMREMPLCGGGKSTITFNNYNVNTSFRLKLENLAMDKISQNITLGYFTTTEKHPNYGNVRRTIT